MANQKEYTIIINGIDKSVNEIDALLKQIDKLEKRLDALGKKEIKISTPTPSSSGGGKAPKADTALEKEMLKNAKLQTEEYQKQLREIEKLKSENKELAKIQKQIADGIRDVNGEYTNTLGGQRAYLADLKSQLSGLDLNDEGWEQLRDKVAEVNQNVLELEKSYGVFNRQVGHYEIAKGLDGVAASAKEANSEVNKLDESAEKLTHTVDDLRNDQKLIVNVKGLDVEFENISQAVSELDDIVQGLAFKLQQMKEAGEENTDEFKKLNAEFQELNAQAASMEKARKFSDELKDSLASSTRGLDMTVQGFQALTAAMEVGSGIAGLFGKNEEEIQEAMNRTVQLMGIAQGVQELYNQTLQKGTFLATANAKANKIAAAIMPKVAAATKAANIAFKALSFTLKALGIGLITTAIALLVEYWDDFVKILKTSIPGIDKLGKLFQGLQQVIAGVGNAVVQWIINPLKTAANVIGKLFKGDFSGAAEAAKKGLIDQFKVVENYQKGATKVAEFQAKKRTQAEKKELAESLKYQIDTLEAKKGNDAKYTAEGQKLYQQYFATLLSMYDKDSDEYKQALLDKLTYERELSEQGKKTNKDKLKEVDEYNKKLKEANKEIADNELESIKSSWAKRKLELQKQKLEEIRIATERGVKVAEVTESINKKYNKLEIDLIKEHQDKITKVYEDVANNISKYKQDTSQSYFDISSKFFEKNLQDVIKAFEQDINRVDLAISQSKENFASLFKSDIPEKILKKESKEVVPPIHLLFKFPDEILKDVKDSIEETNRLFADPMGTVVESAEDSFKNLEETLIREQSTVLQQYKFFNDNVKRQKENLEKTFKLGKIDESDYNERKKQFQEEAESYDVLNNYLEKNINEKLKTVKQIEEYHKTKDDGDISIIPAINLLNNALQKEAQLHNAALVENDNWYRNSKKLLDDYLKDYQITQEEFDKLSEKDQKQFLKEKEEAEKNHAVLLENLEIEKYRRVEAITGEHYAKVNEIVDNNLEKRNEIVRAQSKNTYNYYSKMFDEVSKAQEAFQNSQSLDMGSMELNFFADFSQNILSINKFKDSFKDLKFDIINEKNKLNDKFKAGIIDEKTFNMSIKELDNLQEQVNLTLSGMEKNWKDWSKNIAELTAAGISIFSQMFGQIAEMQYQNEMKRIEKEREILDEEYEMLEENLQKQEELYDEHNDHVQGIEDELANARGDRREFLLGKIDEEMKKREAAWNQEQKIERQKKINERKKEQLEKQQEAAEKKRNKRQKAIQILQATASTALAVTNALSLQPFPLGLAMSALAAALGAAQIAVIAKTKYANGGLLQGKSHAQGGIPVGNTGIEVEGSEYIINKKTTQANLPLVEMINSKKRKLNVNDFIEFYDKPTRIQTPTSGSKFENGGIIPSINFNPRELAAQAQTDNREIWVSVQEIERVSNHLRNVKAISGLDDND